MASNNHPDDWQTVSTGPAQPDDWQAVSDPSATEAALRGGVQGATLGFGDELEGAGRAVLDKVLASHPDQPLADLYRAHRDYARAQNAAAQKAHPYLYGGASIAGGVLPALATGGATEGVSGAALLGGAMAAGSSDADLTKGDVGGLAKDAAIGAGMGGVAGAVLPVVGQGLKSVAGKVAGSLGGTAEKLAVKATGASGTVAREEFAPGIGRELLDRGIVKFGNDPEAIGQNAQAAMDAAEDSKQTLIDGPLQGSKVDRNTVLNYIRGKIAALKGDESQVGLVKALENKVGDIEAQLPEAAASAPLEESVPNQHIQDPLPSLRRPTLGRDPVTGRIVARSTPATLDGMESEVVQLPGEQMGLGLPEAPGPSSEVPLAKSEDIRRSFDKQAKWDSNTDAPTREAAGITANAYREAGENAATAVDPALGAQFQAAKDTQHLLIPVQEAAEKRALQLQQSPHGGLLDMTAAAGGAGVGALLGGPVGSVVGGMAGVAAKTLRPRYASMGAVTTDWLSKAVAASPSAFGKYAAPLAQAAARGPDALAAAHYVLQQTQPEYRERIDQARGPAEGDNQ